MSEKKPTRNDNSISEEIVDNMKENLSRSIDEIAKAPASEVQELSELQKEAAEISNNIVIAVAAENHKEHATGVSADATVPKQVSEQVVTYSDEITENFKSFTGLYSRLAMDAVELTRQNSRLYGAAIDAFNSHNLNLLNTWISYWKYPLQQQ
jgi:hypothetical protein